MINADDYLILWREGKVSFSYCIMTTCAAQGSKDKKKSLYILLPHVIKKMCNMTLNLLKKNDYEMIRPF